MTTPKRKPGRPPGPTRCTQKTLREVWTNVETLRRTRPSLRHVDDACDEFARRGFIEWNPDKNVGWISTDLPPSPWLRRIKFVIERGGKKLKVSSGDNKESYRKMYDAAEAMRKTDEKFRSLTDSLLANALLRFDKRRELEQELSTDEIMSLLEMTAEKRAILFIKYPSPPKRRPGRSNSR